MYKGIDISAYQHSEPINWDLVASSGVRFVIEKITEGTNYINPYFDDDYVQAREHNIAYDAYVFWHPGESLKNQLGFARNHLIGTHAVPELDLELIEGHSWPELRSQAIAYLRDEPTALFYSNEYFLTCLDYLYWPEDVRVNRLWLSLPQSSDPSDLPYNPLIWQWSWSGIVPGIADNVDMDWFIDESKFNSWAKLEAPTSPTPIHLTNKDDIMYTCRLEGTDGPRYAILANTTPGEVPVIKKEIDSEELATALAHIGVEDIVLPESEFNAIATVK